MYVSCTVLLKMPYVICRRAAPIESVDLYRSLRTSWIKIDQFDVTCLLFHYLMLNMFQMLVVWYLYAGWSLHKDTTPTQPSHTVTPTHIEPEQYNTWNKSTISRKLLRMDVLTFETCWAVNNEIIKQVTSSWSIFIQLSRWCMVQ
jgi:hypothetical protein